MFWISVFYCLFCPLMELIIHIKDLIQPLFSGTFATDFSSSWIRLFIWRKWMTNNLIKRCFEQVNKVETNEWKNRSGQLLFLTPE